LSEQVIIRDNALTGSPALVVSANNSHNLLIPLLENSPGAVGGDVGEISGELAWQCWQITCPLCCHAGSILL